MARITLSRALGLLIVLPVLLGVGAGAGAASASEPVGAVAHQRVRPSAPSMTVQDAGNNNASVTGVGFCNNLNVNNDCWTWVDPVNDTPCPLGHFCIYANEFPEEGGKVFSFFHCKRAGADWALQAWNGRGFVWNNNTGGAHGFLKNSSHVVLSDGNKPVGTFEGYNFIPVWFLQAC